MEPDIDNLIDLSQAKRIVAQLRGRIETLNENIEAHHQASAAMVSENRKLTALVDELRIERDTFAHGARIASDNCVRLEGLLAENRALVRQRDARVDELMHEAVESDELRMKLSALLRDTAAALKGEPASRHSWHDLPVVAHGVVADLKASHRLTEDLAELLRRTAAVFRGPPDPDTAHSLHDLPELARAAVEQNGTAAIRAAAAPLELWWAMIEAQEELAGEPPIADNAVLFHFMGSGASTQVTARQLRELFAVIYPARPAE